MIEAPCYYKKNNKVIFHMPVNWESFVGTLAESAIIPDYNKRPLWRGQANPIWRVWSVAERNFYSACIQGENYPDRSVFNLIMEDRLKVFKDSLLDSPFMGALKIDISRLEDSVLWVFGRHYGLESPMLDWSTSPYIAIFFAYSDYVAQKMNHGHIALYRMDHEFTTNGLRYRRDYSNKVARKSDYSVTGDLQFVKGPFDFYNRQKAQCGVFTWLLSEEYFDTVDFLSETIHKPGMVCYLLPAYEAEKVLASLMDMNIHYASLFPDPIGAAKHANTRYNILWKRYSKNEFSRLRARLNAEKRREGL
jgi:hypothetical protein